MKKLLSATLALALAAGACLSFAACELGGGGGDQTHTAHSWSKSYTQDGDRHYQTCNGCNEKNYSDHDYVNGVCVCGAEQTITEEKVKMGDFLSKNHAIAEMFVANDIRTKAIQAADEDVMSEKCTLVASQSDEEIHAVNFVYTVKTGETSRAVKIATVTFKEDLSFDKIVEHYSSQTKVANNTLVSDEAVTVDTQTIFTFDAKVCHDKQAVADAVYAAYNKTSDVKLFAQLSSPRQGFTRFQYLENKGTTLNVHQFDVMNSKTEEGLIANIGDTQSRRDRTVVSTHKVDGTEFYSEAYELEDIKGGIDIPGPTPVEVTYTKAQITEALDANYAKAAAQKCFSSSFNLDADNFSNTKWHINTDADGNIVDAEYSFNYSQEDGTTFYAIAKVDFSSPVKVKDLVGGKAEAATYTRAYRFNYNSNIQDENADLTAAICQTLFKSNEEDVVARYIVDNGESASDENLGYHHAYTVVEVTKKGVKESNINIKKNSLSDTEYVSKLSNEENYRVYNEKSYDITGSEVQDVTVTELRTEKF